MVARVLVVGLGMVVPSLCGVGVLVSVSLLVPCAPVLVLASVAFFCRFGLSGLQPGLRLAWVCLCLVVSLVLLCWFVFLRSLLSVSLFRPRAALLWEPLSPLRISY